MKNEIVISIYIYGSEIKFALVSEKGKILKKYTSYLKDDYTKNETLDILVREINEINRNEKASCIGISFCGIVDRETGEVLFSPSYLKWKGFKLKQEIQKRISIPVFIENDAKSATLGEKWFGEGKDCANFVLLTLTSGVGSGAICNNHLIIGKDGVATEIGHFTIDPDGPECVCGKKGCIESYTSELGLKNRVYENYEFYSDSILNRKVLENSLKTSDIFEAYQENDGMASLIIRKAINVVGIAISYLINTFNPEKVIISGHISKYYKPFIDEVKDTIDSNVVGPLAGSYEIIFTKIDEDAYILGAASVALEMNRGYYSQIEKKELRNNILELKKLVDKQTKEIDSRNTKIIQTNKQLIVKERELERVNKMLEASEEKLKLALAASEKSMWEYDFAKEKIIIQKYWMEENNMDTTGFDYSINALFEKIHPEDVKKVKKELEEAQKTQSLDLIYRIKDITGEWVWVYQKGKILYDENTEEKMAVGTIENFSLQKKKAEELEYKAHYDSLTNLPNRDFLMEKLYYEIRRHKAKKRMMGIFFIDIDNFKQINDTYGHNVGDKVLKIFTEKLKRSIKKTDFLSRYAGDEFILLVTNIIYMGEKEVKKIAERLINQFEDTIMLKNKKISIHLSVHCSIGISLYPNDSRELNKLIHFADRAMYEAKKSGKNKYKFFSEANNI
ncbi:MAG: glucokinase [Kosmotogales bacterium]|nr:glucokinase [Kosmotogales bacterium]